MSERKSAEALDPQLAIEQLCSTLQEARENIASRFGSAAKNNIDADLIARIDAALATARKAGVIE